MLALQVVDLEVMGSLLMRPPRWRGAAGAGSAAPLGLLRTGLLGFALPLVLELVPAALALPPSLTERLAWRQLRPRPPPSLATTWSPT